MYDFSYTVERTQGGIGSDAWTARATMSDAGVSMSMSARNETAAGARECLRSKLHQLQRSIVALYDELK